jgi:hypothetical protein
MRKSRFIGAIIIAVLMILQLFPSGRPDISNNNKDDLIANNTINDTVTKLIRNACYDCHSNETKYPWYSYVAPVSWLVSRDVRMGRENLNFSNWESYSKLDKAEYLDDISDEVSSGEMPLPIYIPLHPEAKLTQKEREILVNWTDEFIDVIFD